MIFLLNNNNYNIVKHLKLFNTDADRDAFEQSANYVEPYVGAETSTDTSTYNVVNDVKYNVNYNHTQYNFADISIKKYDAEIDYLQSSGTQYIELPLNVTTGTYFEVGGEITALHPNDNKFTIFGATPYYEFQSTFYSFNDNYNTFASVVGNKSNNGGWSVPINTKTSFILSTTKLYSSLTNKSVSRPLTDNITLFKIFGGYQNDNRYPVKFHSFYIKAGTTFT